jgi:hypothetical protein
MSWSEGVFLDQGFSMIGEVVAVLQYPESFQEPERVWEPQGGPLMVVLPWTHQETPRTIHRILFLYSYSGYEIFAP